MTKILARIPFEGFYSSTLDAEIDREFEYEAEALADQYDVSGSDVLNMLFDLTDFGWIHRDISKAYVDEFDEALCEHLGFAPDIVFESLRSPREYNFETDKIFVNLPLSSAVKILRRVGKARLRDAARQMFTSCSGFISFYSSDIDDWGSLRAWDHNQWFCVFTALVDMFFDDGDFEYHMVERLRDRDVITDAVNSADSWCRVENDLSADQAEAREKEAAGEDGDDDEGEGEAECVDSRVFPSATVSTTSEYVAQFCKLNNLKG